MALRICTGLGDSVPCNGDEKLEQEETAWSCTPITWVVELLSSETTLQWLKYCYEHSLLNLANLMIRNLV
jgi:hypothetical protein